MKVVIKSALLIVFSLFIFNFNFLKKDTFKPKKVFKSKDLIITQISENAFVHTSYLQTQDFGNVPCNGLFVRDSKETIIFDTPTSDKGSEMLINWIQKSLHCKINAIIPTHFHKDCLGGLEIFDEKNIPSYANVKTIELAEQNKFNTPKNSFNDSLILKVGSKNIVVKFFGEGHTKDNVIGYFPSENIMFGGCLIKEIDATKGNLGDANITDWSATVRKIKNEYPNVKIVVPGHGKFGNAALLDYTINLFNQP